MKNFINTKIVIWKVFYICRLLEKFIKKSWTEHLTNSMLRACPTILYMFELWNNFDHLLTINCHVFSKKLLNRIWTKIQEDWNFFEFVRVCWLVYMNNIGKYLRQCGKYVRIKSPFNFWQKITKNYQLIHVYQHFFAYTSQQSIQRVFQIILLTKRHLNNFLNQSLNHRVLFLHVNFVQFCVLWFI